MASYTGNLNLKKPALDDDALITDINNNMDILDAAVNGIQDGLAIVANGNTHVAITAGQFVYVRNHGTLTEGLYVASSNIAANATLSTSNLTADAAGGLNALNGNIAKKANSKNVSDGLSNIDLNTMKETGIYGIELATNAPAGYAYGTLTVERYDQNGLFVNQTWRDAAQTVVFIRNFHNNSWTAWEELALKNELTLSTNISVPNLVAHKSLNTIFLTFYNFNIGGDGKTLTQVVPSGYRPYEKSVFVGKTYNGSSYVDCIITFDTDGSVTITDLFNNAIANIQAGFITPKQFMYEYGS